MWLVMPDRPGDCSTGIGPNYARRFCANDLGLALFSYMAARISSVQQQFHDSPQHL